MALTAANVIDRAARTLNDPEKATWTETELLEYLSDAQRAAVLVRPECNLATGPHQLIAGTKQSIPDDAYMLIEATRNLGGDGITAGGVITPSSRASLDQTRRDWHSAAPNATVKNFIYDIRNRSTFWVYPPQPDANQRQIELVYAKIPGEIAIPGATLELDDIFEPALLAYILHRAHIKDTAAEGQSLDKAAAYFQWFMALLTGRAEEIDADMTMRHEVMESERGVPGTPGGR